MFSTETFALKSTKGLKGELFVFHNALIQVSPFLG